MWIGFLASCWRFWTWLAAAFEHVFMWKCWRNMLRTIQSYRNEHSGVFLTWSASATSAAHCQLLQLQHISHKPSESKHTEIKGGWAAGFVTSPVTLVLHKHDRTQHWTITSELQRCTAGWWCWCYLEDVGCWYKRLMLHHWGPALFILVWTHRHYIYYTILYIIDFFYI